MGYNRPWCCVGDFNDLLCQDDKRGLHEHTQWLFSGFRQASSDCNLIDLPMVGYPYTWVRFKGRPNCVEERLDRAFVNDSWLAIYPNVQLRNVVAPISDHSPLVLNTEVKVGHQNGRTFKFENKWLLEPNFKPFVESCWNDAGGLSLVDRLYTCSSEFSKWGRELAMQFRRDINKCKQKLESLRGKNDQGSVQVFEECRGQLLNLLMQEESQWKQRAK